MKKRRTQSVHLPPSRLFSRSGELQKTTDPSRVRPDPPATTGEAASWSPWTHEGTAQQTFQSTQSPARARPSKAKKGTVIPYHSQYVQKYSCNLRNGPTKKLLKRYMKKSKTVERNPELLNEVLDLIAASLAQSTWKRYDSALRLWKLFKQQSEKNLDFLDVNSWSESFIVWGWSIRHLAISTLKIYLAELKKLGKFASGLRTPKGCLEKNTFPRNVELELAGVAYHWSNFSPNDCYVEKDPGKFGKTAHQVNRTIGLGLLFNCILGCVQAGRTSGAQWVPI